MKRIFVSAGALLLAGAASAQLLGGHAAVGVGAQVPNPLPSVGQTVGNAGSDVTRTTTDTARAATDTTAKAAGDTTRTTDRVASASKPVHVDAGASVRVERGTRCYYDDYYYDPVYRDGTYYCERTGPGAAIGVSAPK